MRRSSHGRAALAGLLAAGLLALGCKEKKPETMYVDATGSIGAPAAPESALSDAIGAAGVAPAPAPDGVVRVAGITLTPPAGWARSAAGSAMRAAEFDAEGVEVVVFYFGPGQGGSAEQNIARWSAQVLGADGAPAPARRDHVDAEGLRLSIVESIGTYQSGMPGAEPTPMANTTLLAAVIEGAPGGSVFVRAVGPTDAVAAQRDSILGFLRSAAPTP